jgi:glyoxylase I family protein
MFREKPTWVESRPSRRKDLGPLQGDPVRRPNVRRANNLKLRGGGLHHVAIEASDFDRSLHFYTEGLGFRNVLTFPEEGRTVAMLDTGDATYVEVFSGGSGKRPSGSILHLALRTGDCDKATEQARSAGVPITQEPTNVMLEGALPYPCATLSVRSRTASKSSCSRPKRSDGCPYLEKAGHRSRKAPSQPKTFMSMGFRL